MGDAAHAHMSRDYYWKTEPSRETGTRARAEKPHLVVLDRGADLYRGCQVRAINGATVTLRVLLELNIVGERQCDASVFSGHTPVVGAPCYCKVDRAANYTVLAVFPSGPADPSQELAYLRGGGVAFAYGFIPRSLEP